MPYVNCPRCHLSIRPRPHRVAPEHCPRCIATIRRAVPMFRSVLPMSELLDDRQRFAHETN